MFDPFGFKRNNPSHSSEQPRNNGMSDGELSAIKKFFFDCGGDGMSMHRCNVELYERYRLVDKDTVEEWRRELIEVKLSSVTPDRTDPRWEDNWQVVNSKGGASPPASVYILYHKQKRNTVPHSVNFFTFPGGRGTHIPGRGELRSPAT